MPKVFEGGAIVVTNDPSKTSEILRGRQTLDFSGIRHDPHGLNVGALNFVLKGAVDETGQFDQNEYKVRLTGPGKVEVHPTLSDAARLALTGYFGVPVIDQQPALCAVV